MSGQRYSVAEASTSLRLAAIAGCAATVTFLFSLTVSQAVHQNWAAVGTRVNTLQPVVPVPIGRTGSATTLQALEASYSSTDTNTYYNAESSFSQMSAIAGGAVLISAALALVRKFWLSQPEKIALLATGGEKAGETRDQMRQLVEQLDTADMRLITHGGEMGQVARSKGIDEVAKTIRADQLSRKDLTPKEVILEMQRGNGRFWMGLSERPDMNAMERRALIMAQAPKICVLSCADSRVPVEIIFDQGLGEIFVVRTAGNILDTNAHGSIEFAVKYLGVKVVMVIGHEACGAVKGAITMGPADLAKEPFDLQVVLKAIKSNLDVGELNKITDSRSRDREAVVLNTMVQVGRLQQNQLIAAKVAEGSLIVCGAFYEISSGIVDLFSLDKNGFYVDL